ncbi:MAG: hypothetical protein HZB55_12205 [Deltaproteobacteria bacterium]|nr:hypothetical protein [Deltaproteobacteria bacterium]
MKKTIRCLTTIAVGVALALPSLALAMDHSAHGAMGADAKGMPAATVTSAMKGKEVRSAKVDGYQFTYHLIDMAEMMKGVPMQGDMSTMKSHHLMLFAVSPDGKPAAQGKVGYMITGPGKAEQKTMAMAMDGGFGADVDLKAKGDYKVTAKAVFGDKTVVDEFTYTVK